MQFQGAVHTRNHVAFIPIKHADMKETEVDCRSLRWCTLICSFQARALTVCFKLEGRSLWRSNQKLCVFNEGWRRHERQSWAKFNYMQIWHYQWDSRQWSSCNLMLDIVGYSLSTKVAEFHVIHRLIQLGATSGDLIASSNSRCFYRCMGAVCNFLLSVIMHLTLRPEYTSFSTLSSVSRTAQTAKWAGSGLTLCCCLGVEHARLSNYARLSE